MATLPINHLKRTLDREYGPGKWEFEQHDQSDGFCHPWAATVRFLNTGLAYQCVLHASGKWTAIDDSTVVICQRLTGILNGRTRDDSGEMAPLVTTNLLTGEKGLLSFATKELKDDFLKHAEPVMETLDKEAL